MRTNFQERERERKKKKITFVSRYERKKRMSMKSKIITNEMNITINR